MSAAFPLARPSRLALACVCALAGGACEDEPAEGLGALPRADGSPFESDSVGAYGVRYPLTAAIGEIWGRRTVWPTHFNVDYLLTNGSFEVTPLLVDGESTSLRRPVSASAVLRAELYAPGASSFSFADYEFVAAPEEDSVGYAERHFFTATRFGVDRDRSGNVEEEEMREVIDGTIAFTGPRPDIAMTFVLVLDDGESVQGGYAGFFEFITRE